MPRIQVSEVAIHALGWGEPTPVIQPRQSFLPNPRDLWNVAQYSSLSSLRAQATNNQGVISAVFDMDQCSASPTRKSLSRRGRQAKRAHISADVLPKHLS